MYPQQVSTATHSDTPQYFIYTKRGTGEAPFAIWYRGRWCPVFRSVTDEEYFAAHPEAAWRFTTRRLPFHHRDYFEFTIVTRDGRTEATGDRWDFEAAADLTTDSFQDRLKATIERLLADPNRAYTRAA
jgi:hypothetical protein